MTNKTITISTEILAPIKKVWELWINPEHIVNWNFASDDWYCPKSTNDLKVGWKFNSTMSAKDKSMSFDFSWTYTQVKEYELIEYTLDDSRKVKITFSDLWNKIKITIIFEMENENSEELQRWGWQSILDNFKKYVELSV